MGEEQRSRRVKRQRSGVVIGQPILLMASRGRRGGRSNERLRKYAVCVI